MNERDWFEEYGRGDDDEDYEAFDDVIRSTCACPYCFCMNTVEIPGDMCGDCLSHAHQG